MKFVADVMLGSLARLMRFRGYDVEYDRNAEDEGLLKRCRYRILLTKDRELAGRASRRAYLVNAVGGEKQLSEVLIRFPLHSGVATRCLLCNTALRKIRKERVRHLVPPFVYSKHDAFFSCNRCRRIYWPGTHYQRMSRVIE